MTDRQINPFSHEIMLDLARSAVGKVDRLNTRGATLVTLMEIEAMACALVASGYLITPTPQNTIEGESSNAIDA